jgi:hypothetical protein
MSTNILGSRGGGAIARVAGVVLPASCPVRMVGMDRMSSVTGSTRRKASSEESSGTSMGQDFGASCGAMARAGESMAACSISGAVMSGVSVVTEVAIVVEGVGAAGRGTPACHNGHIKSRHIF